MTTAAVHRCLGFYLYMLQSGSQQPVCNCHNQPLRFIGVPKQLWLYPLFPFLGLLVYINAAKWITAASLQLPQPTSQLYWCSKATLVVSTFAHFRTACIYKCCKVDHSSQSVTGTTKLSG